MKKLLRLVVSLLCLARPASAENAEDWDPGNVRATQAPNASLGAVLRQLFHGHNGSAASTHYLISYTPTIRSVNVTGSGNTWAAGDTYTQVG